mmetsp:Transcript_2463/g.5352  ORF Transcript_2463/g.5352 Transcript_2463/m.5352 type:complete len:158 (-) Transcript_2463:413-886(-)
MASKMALRWSLGGLDPRIVDDLTALGVADPLASPCDVFFAPLAKAKVQTLALSVLVCMEMLKALSAVSVNASMLSLPPTKNPWLLVGCAVPFGLHYALLKAPKLASVFGLTSLDGRDWKAVLALALPILLLEEALKAVGRFLEQKRAREERAPIQAL